MCIRDRDSGEEECDMGRRHKEDASIEKSVSNAVESVEAESVEEEQEGPMIPF